METDALCGSAVHALQIGLERVGWTIIAAEIDLSRGTARIEVKRSDGRYITFDARNGRSTITREHMGRHNVLIRQVRGGHISERIEMTFLGRSSHEGARSGLRALCSYIADNAISPISAIDVRRLFTLFMDGDRHAIASAG